MADEFQREYIVVPGGVNTSEIVMELPFSETVTVSV
jgi:hypothetical protein